MATMSSTLNSIANSCSMAAISSMCVIESQFSVVARARPSLTEFFFTSRRRQTICDRRVVSDKRHPSLLLEFRGRADLLPKCCRTLGRKAPQHRPGRPDIVGQKAKLDTSRVEHLRVVE